MGLCTLLVRVWLLVVAVVFMLNPCASAQGLRLSNLVKINPNGSVTLLHHVPLAVANGSARRISSVRGNQIFDFRIVLPSKDQAGLDQMVQQVYNPKSPLYRKYLTHLQIIQQFGASLVDLPTVLSELGSYGLTVYGQSDDGRVLKILGTAAGVRRAFHVNMNNYIGPDGKGYFSIDADPTLEPVLAGKISGIVGLDNMRKFINHSRRERYLGPWINHAQSSLVVQPMLKLRRPAFSGPAGSVAPGDLLTAYNLNGVASTGGGQTLALFELDGYTPSDITQYTTLFNLHPVPPLSVVPVDGGFVGVGANTGEVVLDIDMAIALSPGLAGIHVYEADQNSNPNAWVDEWNQIFTDDNASVVSCSWGLSETDLGLGYDHTVFQLMALQGQTVFVSTGDSGAYCNCPTSVPPGCAGQLVSVDDPASDPYVTGVGISILSVNGSENYAGETASLQGGGGISGSNTSSNSGYSVPIPAFQTASAAGAVPSSLVSKTNRNVPDVVLNGDPAAPYAIFISDPFNGTGWYLVWGSSAASPLWGAFLSRVNQGRAAGGLPVLGWANPALYEIAQSPSYGADFHDITVGNNSFYPAKAGFDDATGLGSFNGANLYNDLTGALPPGGLLPSPGNATVGLTWIAAPGATSYNVKRSVVNGGPYATISAPGAVTLPTYTDNAVSNGTTYYYVISSVSGAGESANSPQVVATPMAAPAAPAGLAAAAGNAQVNLTWLSSPTAASYNVKRALVNGGPYATISASGTVVGLSYTDSGLVNGTTYYYVVSAVNVGGESANSAQASAQPSVPPVLSPTNLSVTILGARIGRIIVPGGAAMTWTQSSSPSITQNKVYRALGAGAFALLATLPPSTSYFDRTTSKGTRYTYEVTAVNANGESAPSNTGSISY